MNVNRARNAKISSMTGRTPVVPNLALSLAFWSGDWIGAQLLLDLILTLEPLDDVDVVFSISGGSSTIDEVELHAFIAKAKGFFRSVSINTVSQLLGANDPKNPAYRDWRPNNAVFRGVVDYFATRSDITAFYYLEPDCCPLKPNWFTQLRKAYFEARKPFMGRIRNTVVMDNGQKLPPHMNGSGIYPNPLPVQMCPKLYLAATNTDPMAAPFDVCGGPEVTPKCHNTDLIYVDFSGCPQIPAQAVVWHGDKQNNAKNAALDGAPQVQAENDHQQPLATFSPYAMAEKTGRTIPDNVAVPLRDAIGIPPQIPLRQTAEDAFLIVLQRHGEDRMAYMRAVKKYKASLPANAPATKPKKKKLVMS